MWDFFEPEEMRWYQWRLDGARAYARKNGDEWRIAVVPVYLLDSDADSGGPEVVEPPSALSYAFVVAKGRTIALRPLLSTMPYLVFARNDIRILPGSEAFFDVSLPPVVRFELDGGIVLHESLPFNVSRTWFGDKTSGSLCLSLPTALDPRCRDEKDSSPGNASGIRKKSLIQCSLLVRNESKAPMELKRLAIYTDMLSIYEKDGSLSTDTVLVHGLADGALKMGIHEGGPDKGRRLTPDAAVGISDLLIRQGMHFLHTITGM
jgi:hypothetical protein